MMRLLQRRLAASLRRSGRSTIRSLLVAGALRLPLLAAGQTLLPDMNSIQSASGQFAVIEPAHSPTVTRFMGAVDGTNFIRLEPAVLSISAERIKEALRRKLGIDPNAPWEGKIFLVLHPAQSLSEDVTIVSQPFLGRWDYRVLLPDVLPQTRFLRAMTSVLLLEWADRHATQARAAQIPAWLADGLSEQLSATGSPDVILSAPARLVNGLPVNRTVATKHGLDALADARDVLSNHMALTFEQLSWPDDAQLSEADGGVYRASAQLFVSELLNLKNGPAELRAMLAALPDCYNWQTAFLNAFHEQFLRPLDVEKWWSLQVVSFGSHDAGPRWTPAVSRDKLDEILSVPVAVWTASNSLPGRTEVSLQAVIRNFEPERRSAILEVKLRDLELAQFRMASPLVALTDGYRRAVAGYLGEEKDVRQPPWSKHPVPKKKTVRETLQRLDQLDAQRRIIESSIKTDVLTP